MLCCLTTDKCTFRLSATFCNTTNDSSNLFWIILAACNVIKEEEWLSTSTYNIVNTHSNCINTDSIMLVHNES